MGKQKLMKSPRFVMLRVAIANSTSLSSVPAAVTTMVLVPLIEIALLVFASIGLTGRADLEIIYSSILVAFGTSVLLGVVSEMTRDRNLQVLQFVFNGRLLHPGYWLSKMFVPLSSAAVIAAVSLLVVFMLSDFSSGELLLGALVALPFACFSGAAVGVCAALFTLAGNDPYLVSNILAAVLALVTGVVLPLADYPLVFEALGRVLPFSWLIEGYRNEQLLLGVGAELLVVGLWVLATASSVRFVLRRWRSGKIRQLLW